MLPKRKLIKKPRNENKAVNIEQTQLYQNPQSLMQRLKSPIPQVKQQAISVIANLRCMLPELSSQQFLREMINILYQSNATLCHQTLCAITNLCEIEPKVVNIMFSLGLDKALINLQATSQSLLKPILIFFITVNEHIKQNYRYLVDGIRQSLTVTHIKTSPQLCLQFIYRTRNSNKSNKVSQQILGEIMNVYKCTQSGSVKSYCVGILGYELMPQKSIQQLVLSHLTQNLVLINLQQQYEMNFPKQQQKKHSNNNNKKQHQQEQEMNQMQQDHMGIQIEHGQNNNKIEHNHKHQTVEQQKMKYFLSAVSGIEVLLEFVLDVMEEEQQENKGQSEWDEEQDDEQDQQQMMQGQQQQQNVQQKQQLTSSITYLKQLITQFLHQNMPIFPKFLSTTAPNTQNLVYLFYHLLLQVAKTLPQTVQTKQEINKLIQVSLVSLFLTVDIKRQTLSYEEYQVLVQCLEIGLGVIMKHKALGVSDQFLLQFTKKYMLQPSIFQSSKLLQMVKPSWLIMLEIFSLRYNPQKNHNISPQHNYLLGQMLKYLIVSLPYSELQQFRCQVVDTVFDVYSNEKFDQIFVKLGYFQLLQHIVKQGTGLKDINKGSKGKKNKQQKFILDVVKDTKRFLEYKNKMIKHK